MRETDVSRDSMHSILHQLMNDFQNDWLLTLEICELSKDKYHDIYKECLKHYEKMLLLSRF